MQNDSNNPVVVVGSGRCGTSLVAGMLDKLGIHMGDRVQPANTANPSGHWEDSDFVALNQARMEGKLSRERFRAAAKGLIEKKQEKGIPWGWKDPRTSEFLGDYLDILEDPLIIYCKRNREDVKANMAKHYSWEDKQSEELISKRILEIEDQIHRASNMTIEFDELINETEDVLSQIIQFTGVGNQNYDKALGMKSTPIKDPKIWIAVLNQNSIKPALSNALTMMAVDGRYKIHITYPNARPEESNRNQIIKAFKKSGFDFLLMIDADIVPRANPLDLVALNKDIINFAAPQWHETDLYWVAMDEVEGGWKQIPPARRRSLQEVDATGNACMLVHKRVFEGMKAPYFQHYFDPEGIHYMGMEYSFCRDAKKAGFKTWVHFDYIASHYKEIDLIEILKLLGR